MKKLMHLFLFVAIICGCKKYLDKKSDDRLAVPKTLADLQALMDDAVIMNQRVAPSQADASADDYFLITSYLATMPPALNDIYLWRATHLNYQNDWNFCYAAIYNCNLVLDLLPGIARTAGNAPAWDRAKGAALFFRAYFYSMLIGQYGKAYEATTAASDSGVPLRLQSDFNQPSTLASVDACYQQILKDALESSQLLPNLSGSDLTRPSRAAAFGLLARINLYMGDYKSTVEYATKSLALNSYLMNYNGDSFIAGLTTNVPFKRNNPEILFSIEQNTVNALHLPLRARIDTFLYASYTTNDLRKTGFFKAASPYQQFKGNYTANATWCFAGLATDELYLTRAEAYAHTNELEKSMDDLNALLIKRFKTGTFVAINGLDKTTLLERIKVERRKELLMRGLRWADLKRYNRDGDNLMVKRMINGVIYELPPNDPKYCLPLPEDVRVQLGLE